MNINDILKKEFNLRDEQINNTIPPKATSTRLT